MKKSVILAAFAAATVLSGCGEAVDPCTQLPAPTAGEIEASRTAEVERELTDDYGDEVECVVVDGQWVNAELLGEAD